MPLRKSQVMNVCGVSSRGGADDVAGDEVVGLVGEGVEGDLVDGLVGEKEADGEVGEGERALRATGSLTTRAPGGMVMEGCPPKVSAVAVPGVMALVPELRAIWAAPMVRGSRPNSLVRMTRTDGTADGDVDDLAEGGPSVPGRRICRRDFWQPWVRRPRCRPSGRRVLRRQLC